VKLPIPKGRRAILAIGLPLGLAAAGGFLFMQMSAAPSAPLKIPDPTQGQLGPMLALDDKVINLTTTTPGGYKYAKVGVTIELRPTAASFYDLHGTDRTKQETVELAKHTEDLPLLIDAVGRCRLGPRLEHPHYPGRPRKAQDRTAGGRQEDPRVG